MAVYFFDTSALAKRYAPEKGTKWVQGLTDPAAGNEIYIARITGAELIASIRLNVRKGETSESDAKKVIADFRRDFTTLYTIVEITDRVVNRAMDLIENHNLRGYDGVQLATAMDVNDDLLAVGMSILGVPALTIVCGDKDVNKAAATEGLIIEDPETHPHSDDLIT
jgi:uncharacterized protein